MFIVRQTEASLK